MRDLAVILLSFLLCADALAGEVRMRPGVSREGLMVPDENRDYSAHRVDADVFGWNKDFTQVGCIGLDLYRRPNSEQNGESFLLVFDTDSVKPVHNVQTLYNTAAPNPENPPPLMDVRDRMWGIDVVFQRLWPKRPKRKWAKGYMKTEMLWEPVPVGDGRCEPAVGFLLKWKGQSRLLPHYQLSDIRVSCDILRLTNNRTYWGRKDVAVVMPKFEFGSDPDNEQSFRHPVSARWDLGRTLKIQVKAEASQHGALRKALGRYGQVQTLSEEGARSGVLVVKPDLEVLARTIRRALPTITRVELSSDPDGPDLLLELGTSAPEPELVSPYQSGSAREDRSSLSESGDSTYLGDFMSPQGRRKRR